MELPSVRAALTGRGCVSHLAGLVTVGFYGTAFADGGFGNGAWVGILAGGILSLPWFAVFLLVIWWDPDSYQRHIVWASIVGPVMVCGSWWLMMGRELLDAVAVSCVTSTVVFMALTFWSSRVLSAKR